MIFGGTGRSLPSGPKQENRHPPVLEANLLLQDLTIMGKNLLRWLLSDVEVCGSFVAISNGKQSWNQFQASLRTIAKSLSGLC